MANGPAIEEDGFEAGPIQQPKVSLPADPRDRLPLFITRHPAGWKRSVVDEHDPSPITHGGR